MEVGVSYERGTPVKHTPEFAYRITPVLPLNPEPETFDPTPPHDCSNGSEHIPSFVKSVIDSGGVPREQNMLKGHLPRVIYHQVY